MSFVLQVGLAEVGSSPGRLSQLKVLHPLLDGEMEVAFIALSNTFLDSAKLNRGVVRPEADHCGPTVMRLKAEPF